MAWAEKMAQELKKRDNPSMGPYIEGTVVSASPLKISILLFRWKLYQLDCHT